MDLHISQLCVSVCRSLWRQEVSVRCFTLETGPLRICLDWLARAQQSCAPSPALEQLCCCGSQTQIHMLEQQTSDQLNYLVDPQCQLFSLKGHTLWPYALNTVFSSTRNTYYTNLKQQQQPTNSKL